MFPTGSREIAPVMERLAGLVTGSGGVLTDTANCAREYGVPHVVGVKGLMDVVRTERDDTD